MQERQKPRALAPLPAKAGGGWEEVLTVRVDPTTPLPSPPLPSQGREQGTAVATCARPRSHRARRGTRSRCSSSASAPRSEEHTSELQSLMRISYAVFCLKKKTTN